MRLAYHHYLYGQDTALEHVRQFAEAARSLGHEVAVRALNLAGDAFGARADAQRSARSALRRSAKQRFSYYLHEPKELLWNLRYFRRELALLRRQPPDVLLVRDHGLTASCVPVARRLGLPLVLEVNAPAVEPFLYEDHYAHLPGVHARLEAYKLHRADAVAVVSRALGEHLQQRHHLDPQRIMVAPNGAETELFHPGIEPDADLPAALRAAPVVGFVGSFQSWHGIELLGRMSLAVGQARPEVRFLFVGDGPEAGELRRITAELEERVLLTGRVPHERVPGLVATLDIGVVAAAGFYMCPLKVLEWMAAGRAVVVPRLAALEELVEDGVTGLLFAPGDQQALVDAVLRLVDAPELRSRLGAAAAAAVRSSLTWRHNAEKILAACEAARERHRAARQPSSKVR